MPKDKEEFVELSTIAIKEFKTLVELSIDLAPEWKKTLLGLLDNAKTPKDIESIKKLMTEGL